MAVSNAPPLNGRRIAEFYVASEVAKKSVLRAYARPPEEQEARIILYDPVRKIIREYFRSGRESGVLDRVTRQLETREFKSRDFTDTWYKANASAVMALRDLELLGKFQDFTSVRPSVSNSGLRLISTADFYATFIPKLGKPRRVGVIVNPSGVTVRNEKRTIWINIEGEIAVRAAVSKSIEVDETMYIDLRNGDITRYRGLKIRIWDEISATCERIVRDWRDIRIDSRIQDRGLA